MKRKTNLPLRGKPKLAILLMVFLSMVILGVAWLVKSDISRQMKSTNVSEPSQGQLLGVASQEEVPMQNLAGYTVFIDPVTGKIVPQPTGPLPLELTEELQNSLSTSSEGLVEIPSPVPGGGTMVRLNGRFQDAMVATTADAGGNISATCLSNVPPRAESESENTLTTTLKNGKE